LDGMVAARLAYAISWAVVLLDDGGVR
jgi:hypothetical protein